MIAPIEDRAEIAKKVAQSCRILGQLDITHGSLGHVSYRLGDSDSMMIKSKGPDEVGLRYTQPVDVIGVDFELNKLDGPEGLWPPGESYIHKWLFKANPETRCVIHMHPRHAVLLTICNKAIYPIYGAYGGGARIAVAGVRTYPKSMVVINDERGEEFAKFVGESKLALMHGHGVAVTGTSIEDATVRCLELNELVTMMYESYLLGTPQQLPDEEIEELGRGRSGGSRTGSAAGDLGTLATWRYYCNLAGESEVL